MYDKKEELTYVLQEFKDGVINYAEAVTKIERIYARQLGFIILEDIQKS